MSVVSWCSACFCVVLCVFCTDHFVMVPFNLTCLNRLQYFFLQTSHQVMLIFKKSSCSCPDMTQAERELFQLLAHTF